MFAIDEPLRAIRLAIALALVPAMAIAHEGSEKGPTAEFCEVNKVAALHAADAAVSAVTYQQQTLYGGGGGLVCLGVSTAVGFTDAGLLSLGCAVLGAWVAKATVVDEAARSSQDAYLRVRDARCRLKFGQ